MWFPGIKIFDTEILVLTAGNKLDITVGVRSHLDCPVMHTLASEVPGQGAGILGYE